MGANAGIVGDDAVSSQTSKTEVLQTPSATHVNRDHGVLVPKSYFSENIIFLKF